VYLDRAFRLRNPEDLLRANERLDAASRITAGMSVADAEIAYQLARFRAELIRREIDGSRALDFDLLDSVVARLEMLIRSSGLTLTEPEVIAARGLIAFERGDSAGGDAAWHRAVSLAEEHGHLLALLSPRSLIHWLGRLIGRAPEWHASRVRSDLIGMLGSELNPETMLRALTQVARRGGSSADT
jgi:hypothetical protein